MRARSFLTVAIFVLPGCAAVLGLRDIEEGTAPETTGDAATPDAGTPDVATEADAEASTPLVDCFGTPRPVFYCDDFEASPISTPPWNLTGDPAASASFAVSTNRQLSGAQSAVADVVGNASGSSFTATARFDRPGPPGPIALQLHVLVPMDSWNNGETMPFASVLFDAQRADLLFTANGTSSNGQLYVKLGSTSVLLGPVTQETWTCLELVADGTNVTAYLGSAPAGSIPAALPAKSVELGFTTSFTGKDFYYDDVIIAPGRVGCPN